MEGVVPNTIVLRASREILGSLTGTPFRPVEIMIPDPSCPSSGSSEKR
jgi:hypothetical protein